MRTHDIKLPPHDATANLGGLPPVRLYSEAKVRAAIEADRKRRGEPVAPPVWVTEQYGGKFDGMTAGQGYRLGWNDCRAAMIESPQPAAPVVKESLTVAEPVKLPSEDIEQLQELFRKVASEIWSTKLRTKFKGAYPALLARYGQPAQPAAHGNAEDMHTAHEAMACQHCGGSGHKDDVQPAASGEQVAQLPEFPNVALEDVQAVVEKLAMWKDGFDYYTDKTGYDDPARKHATITDVKRAAKYLYPRLKLASIALTDLAVALDHDRSHAAHLAVAPVAAQPSDQASIIVTENGGVQLNTGNPEVADKLFSLIDQFRAARPAAEQAQQDADKVDALLEAAQALADAYKGIADSGDAGFWKAEKDPRYVNLMAAIDAINGRPAADQAQQYDRSDWCRISGCSHKNAGSPAWETSPVRLTVPNHLIERLHKHLNDKANTAFARSTMSEALQYLTSEQS